MTEKSTTDQTSNPAEGQSPLHNNPKLIDIVSSLKTQYQDGEAKHLFQRFLEKGLLAKCGVGYAVPIPSMHHWMVDQFACEQIKSSPGPPTHPQTGKTEH